MYNLQYKNIPNFDSHWLINWMNWSYPFDCKYKRFEFVFIIIVLLTLEALTLTDILSNRYWQLFLAVILLTSSARKCTGKDTGYRQYLWERRTWKQWRIGWLQKTSESWALLSLNLIKNSEFLVQNCSDLSSEWDLW